MLVTAAAVLIAVAQAQSAQAAVKEAVATRKGAAALLEAKAQADAAAEKARAELDRVRAQAAEELAACRSSLEQAQIAARAELEQIRIAAANEVTNAHEAAQAAIQHAIADRDRIVAERTAKLRQQIEQTEIGAQAQVQAIGDRAEADTAKGGQLVTTQRDESTDTTNALATTRPRGPSRRRASKMIPALVDKAQQMYDSGHYTVAEIAKSCAVSPTTIYRHIHVGQTTQR